MDIKNCFIKATEEYNTFERHVPAHYFRKVLFSETVRVAKLTVAVCGFYELYFNGVKITKGFLSPYISNPDHYVYYDEYDITIEKGNNVFGVLLGNGFQNNPGGYIWDFDKADFRSAPSFAVELKSGNEIILRSGTDFKTCPSPIRFDDYRFGEHYDANFELNGWNTPEFDDSLWQNALSAIAPAGELRMADISPITTECELVPANITECKDGGYIYDFGRSGAGVCRLTVNGFKGQKIELIHAESLKDGDLDLLQIWFDYGNWERDKDIVHKDIYVCKGDKTETYQPTFVYHGFRYVKVKGITSEQATNELLKFLVYHTEMNTMGDFSCSHPGATYLQQITKRSIVSNFHHFPTDCPQREKNGWTADAALTCEAALLNFNPERNYREWIRNILKAQREDGALPGIIPTGGWGFHWGNGPAWDSALVWIPYYTYIYRGDTEMIRESADGFIKYLRYLRSRTDENGLLSIGLGDWCQVGGGAPKSPLVVTDTITSMDLAFKIGEMLDAVNLASGSEYARSEGEKYKKAIRANLVDNTLTVLGECQTSQAMALYYGVFDESEETAAFQKLLDLIRRADGHIDLGVLGGRVIFHVLTRFGYGSLAFNMIVREDYPSYGNWLVRGATTLWENFLPDSVSSMNHCFWGDISGWFIKSVAGINLNPHKRNINELEITPCFIEALEYASAYHIAPAGKISVSWRRSGENVLLELEIPEKMAATVKLRDGYTFENGASSAPAVFGEYKILKPFNDKVRI